MPLALAIHFHVRDADQRHILDAGLYREALLTLRQAVPDMHLQITTEAVGRYSRNRCASWRWM